MSGDGSTGPGLSDPPAGQSASQSGSQTGRQTVDLSWGGSTALGGGSTGLRQKNLPKRLVLSSTYIYSLLPLTPLA